MFQQWPFIYYKNAIDLCLILTWESRMNIEQWTAVTLKVTSVTHIFSAQYFFLHRISAFSSIATFGYLHDHMIYL